MVNKWMQRIDLLLLISVLGLLFTGLIALYSSSYSTVRSSSSMGYFNLQLIWILIGLVIMAVMTFIPYKIFQDFAYVLYFLSLILLVAVLLFGSGGSGAQRWLRVGMFRFQPSEFAKLAVLLASARYLSSARRDINRPKTFVVTSFIFIIPFLLILKQPDLGTALALIVVLLPLCYWAGLKPSNLFLLITPIIVLIASFNFYFFLAVMIILLVFLYFLRRSVIFSALNFALNIAVGLITPVLWSNLKDYQQQRIKIFLNPEADPLGAGYQIIQSKVAIGSGGLFGRGYLQGSQTQLRFLPEQHTDFIYAIIGEEFGFVGVLFGLAFFAVFLLSASRIASLQKSAFNSIVAIGIATLIGFHMVVNIGMTIGLLPVTGLPLPFISYGGSAMLTNMAMTGLLLNFYRNRYLY